MATRLLLSSAAVARTRFAWSPMAELVGAVQWLRDPARARRHVPWLVEAAGALSPPDVALLTAAVPGGGVPGFLLPSGSGAGSVYRDLAEVQRAAPETVLAQYGRWYPDGPPDRLARLLDDRDSAVPDLVAALARGWQALVEPAAVAVESCIATELRARERGVAHDGLAATVEGLHPSLSWCGDAVVAAGGTAEHVVGPAGLRLLPSVLVENVTPVDDADPVTVLYPAHGRRAVWERPYGDLTDSAAEVLSSLLGPQRARIIAELVWPRGTTALARRLGLSPSVVSRHLSVLEAAGLVRRSREGRRCICSLTAAGAELLTPARAADVLC